MKYEDISLKGKVALVTGSSRGIGKGVALELGTLGATVYVTGRTVDGGPSPEGYAGEISGTVGQTAREIDELGGIGIAAQCDHSNDDDVRKLFDQIERDHGGLDILVNNAFSGPDLVPTLGKKCWDVEGPIAIWDQMNRVGNRSSYVASIFAAPYMIKRRSGLIANIGSYGSEFGEYMHSVPYGIAKAGLDKLACDMGLELEEYGIPFVSLWAGYNRTELMMQICRDDGKGGKEFAFPSLEPEMLRVIDMKHTENPRFSGRAVAAIYSDPERMKYTRKRIPSAEVAMNYGYTDIDGNQPPVFHNHAESTALMKNLKK